MRRFNIDKETFIFLYKKYRDFLIPAITIIICFILLVKIIIPQINSLSKRGQEMKAEKTKLDILKNNLKLLVDLNESTLDSQLAIASDALPSTKNFTGVLNEVSLSANKSGVFLGDFEFQVGDLSKLTSSEENLPSLQLTLIVNGGVTSAVKFINELYKSLPLAEVKGIEINNLRSTMATVFYYKQFSTDSVNPSAPLSPLSSNDLSIIKDFSSWNNPKVFEQIQRIPTATGSAKPSSPF